MMHPPLLDRILSHSTDEARNSRVHGPAHWASVAAAALVLLDGTPAADPKTVLLFALLHDSQRLTDGRDPEHGARGAELARRMRDAGEFELGEACMERLVEACRDHDKGTTSSDPTIGVCFDADRLNLWRVGRRPNPALLSTPAARALTEQATRFFSMFAFDWRALFSAYARVRSNDTTYLRFGDVPAGERSGWPLLPGGEVGVSVYPARRLSDGRYALDFERLLLGIDTTYLSLLLREGRPLYRLEGEQTGIGGMGEPLLKGVRLLEEIPPERVSTIPERERFRALLEAWRQKREGKNVSVSAFRGVPEPDERPFYPGVPGKLEARANYFLEKWGLFEFVEGQRAPARAEPRAKRAEPKRARTLSEWITRPERREL